MLLLIVDDFHADPGTFPCLAKGIAAGRFVDLALAHCIVRVRSLKLLAGLSLMTVLGPGEILWLPAPMRWLLRVLLESRHCEDVARKIHGQVINFSVVFVCWLSKVVYRVSKQT